jgi:hypothetical protein
MLKWSVSSASDKRPVVTRKGEHNADVYSYNGSLAVPGDIEREHTEECTQTHDQTTDMSHLSNKAKPEFRPRNYLISTSRLGLHSYAVTGLNSQKLNLNGIKVPYKLYLFQGSDPRAATCRGKLQSKRSRLNVEINKAMMLRSGAENLHK